MEIEIFQTLAVNIKVEIFDLDMRETIWPVSDDDKGVWLPKEIAQKMTDDQIGKWFMKRFLLDYGNSFEYTVTRGSEEIKTFKRTITK